MINVDDVVQGITVCNESRYSRISIDGLKKILGGKEMRNVTRGSGCCYWKCGATTANGEYAEGYEDGISQDECWNWMEKYCAASFTIQPCPWK